MIHCAILTPNGSVQDFQLMLICEVSFSWRQFDSSCWW